jgi:hypothetical protein
MGRSRLRCRVDVVDLALVFVLVLPPRNCSGWGQAAKLLNEQLHASKYVLWLADTLMVSLGCGYDDLPFSKSPQLCHFTVKATSR